MWILTGFRKLRDRKKQSSIKAEPAGEAGFARERMQRAQSLAKERLMLADAPASETQEPAN